MWRWQSMNPKGYSSWELRSYVLPTGYPSLVPRLPIPLHTSIISCKTLRIFPNTTNDLYAITNHHFLRLGTATYLCIQLLFCFLFSKFCTIINMLCQWSHYFIRQIFPFPYVILSLVYCLYSGYLWLVLCLYFTTLTPILLWKVKMVQWSVLKIIFMMFCSRFYIQWRSGLCPDCHILSIN